MERFSYDLIEEPTGETYKQLIQCSMQCCGEFSLVIRDSVPLKDSATRLVEKLAPFTTSRSRQSEWPGTELLDETATVLRVVLSSDSAGVLEETALGLFDWVQPGLPEDLCLYRFDGAPWLVTIAHEKDGYLLLSPAEKSLLAAGLPQLALSEESI